MDTQAGFSERLKKRKSPLNFGGSTGKATTEYHRTKDILHVKQLLGHKNLSSTMKYIDIDRAVYGEHEDDEFVSRVARSLKGARALLEAGFEYITDMNGYKLFRKRT